MKVNIEDCYNSIEIEECLEPTGASYIIRQGDNKILINTEYSMKMLIKSLNFLKNVNR